MSAARVLVVSGSTRAASTNSALARTAVAHPPAGVDGTACTGLAALPHVDPDLDQEPLPAEAVRWGGLVDRADVVLVCTPEPDGLVRDGAARVAIVDAVAAAVTALGPPHT